MLLFSYLGNAHNELVAWIIINFAGDGILLHQAANCLASGPSTNIFILYIYVYVTINKPPQTTPTKKHTLTVYIYTHELYNYYYYYTIELVYTPLMIHLKRHGGDTSEKKKNRILFEFWFAPYSATECLYYSFYAEERVI